MASLKILRGVAQLVSAPALGAGGHKFESCYPDRKRVTDFQPLSLFLYSLSIADDDFSHGMAKMNYHSIDCRQGFKCHNIVIYILFEFFEKSVYLSFKTLMTYENTCC